MNIKLSKTRRIILISILSAVTCIISSCHHPGVPIMDSRVELPNPNYKLYKSDARGDSHLFKFLFVFNFSSGGFPDAIEDLWKRSKIPDAERDKYLLVNVTRYRGVDWSILIFEEEYYSVVGDIVEIVRNPDSPSR